MLANTFEYVYVIIPTLLHLLKVVFFCFLNKPWKGKRRYRPWKASFSVSMIKSRWYACFEDLKFESLTAECINPRVTFQFVHTQCLLESFVDGFVSRSCDPKNPAVGFLLRFFTIWRSQTSENITTSVCTIGGT